jgi:hypothetical protein
MYSMSFEKDLKKSKVKGNTKMAETTAPTKAAANPDSPTALVKEPAEPEKTRRKPRSDLAEFKYIGDDGGRWVFERRTDGLCITIDKPKILLNGKTKPTSVRLTVQGFHVHEAAIALCRK